MNRNSILLLTKDALCKDYLPIYGNKYWAGKTPNLDELAAKGTVFNRQYTSAPSTVMSFRSMTTGLFAHEQPYSKYLPKDVEGSPTDLFETAKTNGFKGHLIWDSTWVKMVLRFGNCYGKDTVIHNMDGLKQGVGSYYKNGTHLHNDDVKVINTIERILDQVKEILNNEDKSFIWIHLPHVINRRTSYGSDIDAFDLLIGNLRKLFNDDNIFISADHGNMNGYNGKYCYGFDVHTSAIEIPLITPRIEDVHYFDEITSNVDIKTLIFERIITHREYVYSDTAYYAQPHRKLSIISRKFCYVYNKMDKTEELYDLENDRYMRCNLLLEKKYDQDRRIMSPVRDYYFSPYWDDINDIVTVFRRTKDDLWRNGSKLEELKNKFFRRLKFFISKELVRFK